MNNFNIKLLTGLIASFLFMFIIPVQTFAKTLEITFNNKKVNIYSENGKLSSIVNEISALTGVKIYLDKSLEDKTISVDIRNASFEKGIKMLAYPLNYVIIRDTVGNIKELRIFKNPGSPDSAYRVFSSSRVDNANIDNANRVNEQAAVAKSASRPVRQSASQAGSQSGRQSVLNPKSEIRNPKSEIQTGGSGPVTGDKAFDQGIWVTKRILETETLRAQRQMQVDQVESAKKELAPIVDIVNIASIQQYNNSNIPLSSNKSSSSETKTVPNYNYNYPTNYNYNASENVANQMLYQQLMSQQRGFNNYIYYQQMMNNSYNNIVK